MSNTGDSPGARGAGAPIVFTWFVSAVSLGLAQLISGQILIFKLEGSPATLALLGIAVYLTPMAGLVISLVGGIALFYAAWHRAPGPWANLRLATWGLALPAAIVLGTLLFTVAEGTQFNSGSTRDGFGLVTSAAWAPLVILLSLAFALLVDSVTRLTEHGRKRSLVVRAGAAALIMCAAVFVPYFI